MYETPDWYFTGDRIFVPTDPVTVTEEAPMDVPGEVDPLIEYLTQSQFYEASRAGVAQFGERQLCIFGKPSPDPVIPGVCNSTALVAGSLLVLGIVMGLS